MGFKTKVQGNANAFRHIVLAVHDTEHDIWGALGMSRRSNLMYKPMVYPSLSALLTDFRDSYRTWTHYMVKVCVGNCCSLWPITSCKLHLSRIHYCTLAPHGVRVSNHGRFASFVDDLSESCGCRCVLDCLWSTTLEAQSRSHGASAMLAPKVAVGKVLSASSMTMLHEQAS